MPFPIVAAAPVVWSWVTASASNLFLASTAVVTTAVGATGAYIEYAKEKEFESDYDESELRYLEKQVVDNMATVSQNVGEIVQSFDASTVAPSDYVPQIEQVENPIIALELTGVSMIEHMAEANRLKQKDLEIKEATLLAIQEQNRKLVNQNEILYKQAVEMMESNKFAAARLVLDKAHTPVISKALTEQAVSVRRDREAIKVQESINETYTTFTQVPAATVNVTNEVATPVVNVSAPTVNNTVDTAPIAAAVSTINATLTPVAQNAIKQKEIADIMTTPRTVLDSELVPLFTGTPIDIHVARNAAQAKNETDEAEIELDDDMLDELATGFTIPGIESFDPDALNNFVLERVNNG